MTNLEVMKEMMNDNFGINNISDYISYATDEINTSEKAMDQFRQLDDDALSSITDTIKEIWERINVCKRFLYWYKVLPYKKIQEYYNIYQRQKPQDKNEIRDIDLNFACDIAYLNCVVKRDIRKSGFQGYLEKSILQSNAGEVKMKINENFPDCIEVYNPTIEKGLIWEPKSKRILQFV